MFEVQMRTPQIGGWGEWVTIWLGRDAKEAATFLKDCAEGQVGGEPVEYRMIFTIPLSK